MRKSLDAIGTCRIGSENLSVAYEGPGRAERQR